MILGKNPAHFHLIPPTVAAVVAATAVAVAAAPLAIEKSPPMRGAKNIIFCSFSLFLSEHLAQTLTISLCSQTFPVVPKISHVESNISFIRVLRGESSLRREPKYGHRHSITTACGNSRRVNDRVTPDFLFVCHRLVPSFDRAPSPVCLI